ncbi:MAG: low molecular weight protein-tyrosine-phosphatase [Bacteroidia bacterium]
MTKILMVCLGNICRSPLAEGILKAKAEKYKLSIQVDSAGTSNYHIGEHPDKRAIKNANLHQIDISKLRARQFTVADFDSFDHIFAMDSSNYTDIIALARNEKDINKVELILNRVYLDLNMAVPDPYFGGEQGFETVFLLLDNACEIIIHSLKNNE